MTILTTATDTWQKWFRKERVYYGSQFENTAHYSGDSVMESVSLVRRQEREAPGHTASSQEAERNTDGQPASFFCLGP